MNSIDPNNWEAIIEGERARPGDWYEQWERVMLKNDRLFSKKQPRIANLFAYHEKLDEDSNWG